MKIKSLVLLCSLIGLPLIANGQENNEPENIVGKGSKMIMGLADFSSISYNSSSDRTNSFSLSTSYDRFYKDNMFIGVGLSGAYQNTNNINSTALAFGPEIGYALGNQKSKVLPFIDGGCSLSVLKFNSSDSYNLGLDLSAGLGVLIPIQKHLGLAIEGKYNNLNYYDLGLKVTGFSLNIGFIGFLL